MTDSHNSGQHKDREAAAAEVRRMWQPTPSWTQPDPNDTEPAEEKDEQQPDALSQEFPGDSWSTPATDQPVDQPAPWTQPQATPPAPSWTQPVAESAAASWTQPEEFDEEPVVEPQAPDATEPTAESPEQTPAGPNSPVFGGSSFHGSGSGPEQSTPGQPQPGQAGQLGQPGQAGQPGQPGPQRGQGGQPLSPAAQHFFPQGIPGQQPPQPPQNLSFRTDDLIQALPLPREAPAERGVRSMLKLRPGSSERSERIARATAATAFRRPVTIVVANPKGGSGKTPTTLLLSGALGQARGGGVVAWDNNELRGNMHLRTHDTNSRSTVTDMLQAMPMLTQPDARLGDVAAYLRHQVSGQYDVLTSATTTYAQIEANDFDLIHRLLSRFYKVLVIDTGNNEGSSNWREAMKAADALVIPIKWKSLSCAAAVQMLEELDNQGPEAQRLIRRAVIAVSNGPGDVNKEVEKQLRPYFESRAAAVVDIPTDMHIAAEGPLDHSALQPATRRAALDLAARVSEQVTIALNAPR
ncbi:MinD-like ATPase involved in chromosome partitioning or flagellar assembly [Kribbella rubisoli]|uniref:MinD-like ATPase involved in chromosome partitioning or flagellar assembly n=1 Tax=Kribbella rubisoli TaxID=3075929 RepID=A0A4Q7XN90_9ACTN|nr:AAA family ATPase [Kribbella rubisoli]RZU24409.1 MinD-like ATPase involved in chromosome partitioning or flagellar assembly [Kribbella rubisoli]